MTGQVLHILDGDVLGEQGGDDHHAERVRADDRGQADIPKPAPEHETDRLSGDAAVLEQLFDEAAGQTSNPFQGRRSTLRTGIFCPKNGEHLPPAHPCSYVEFT